MGRVVEPLRSELIEKICKPRSAGMSREAAGKMIDLVCTAIDERLEEHGGEFAACSAVPLEDESGE